MGRMSAVAMAEEVKENGMELAAAIRWHLQYNHYPPIHLVFVPTALEAIEAARAEEWDKVIDLPNGKRLKVWKIVEELHLDSFLE